MQKQDNIFIRHERIRGQRTLIDTVHIGIGPDLPAAAVICQMIDFGTAEEPERMPGPIDVQFTSPSEAITGTAPARDLLSAKQLNRYAVAMKHVATVLDQWETIGRIPEVLKGVRS